MSKRWTAEETEKLIDMWSNGFSGSKIAEIMGGITRNAVMGKIFRLNLSVRETVVSKPRGRIIKARCFTCGKIIKDKKRS